MLKPGDFIENRYKVDKLLGRGGMSTVYLIHDNRLDHQWVLKEFVFTGPDANERDALEDQFEKEAKLLARLDHPYLPKVIDYFSQDESHFLVEEYVEGKTLLQLIMNGEMELADYIDVVIRICEVLNYIHKQGIIYRDLKPDNVIVKENGDIKLVDFGIARIFKAGKPKDTVIVGTPGFAAPEQYGTSQTDPRSDIYSLGALLHFIITGRDPREKPFDFDPPEEYGVNPPTVLSELIMKNLSLKPEQRHEDVNAVKDELISIRKQIMATEKASTAPLSNDGGEEADAGGQSADAGEAPEKSESSLRRIMTLVYVVVLFMLVALLVEIRFRIWILIPYFLVASVIAYGVLKLWQKSRAGSKNG